MLYGIDVHPRYQAGLNFDTIAQQGYSFAAIKATQGEYLQVALFADWINRARAAGLIPGAYHWIVAGDGGGQAEYFYNYLQRVGGPDGLLIQLDCEDDATLTDVRSWVNRWNQLSGGHPFLIYTGGWWWRPRGWDGLSLTPYLWSSQYLTADLDTVPDDPAAFAAKIPSTWWVPGYGNWPSATFLQFTSKGDAGGLGNNVDLNATKLTREQVLALTVPGGVVTDYTRDEMRAFAWQYMGRGITGNDDTLENNKSTLYVLDQTWQNTAKIMLSLGDLDKKLDSILALLAQGGGSGVPADEIRKIVREELDATGGTMRLGKA